MRPWNPHSQTFHGEPIVGQTPVRLVVRGPELTPQQGAMLQAAYASFASGARLSIVPNPSAQGSLPDGSQYTIDCVNGVCTCVVWTVGGEDMRRSGIGISLTTLNGGLVHGHIHKDGLTPQPYILTPEVLRGTRTCTGKWRVRKVDGYSGGKAVWGNKAGSKFVAGVGGVIYDIDLMDYRSLERIFGTNSRAYWAGEYMGGTHIYRDGEKLLGAFRDRLDTLPFFRKRANGELWVMQITPVFLPEPKLQLYGEKYAGGESTATIGDLLDEMSIPVGYTMIWQTISVSPDGNNARMTLRRVSDSLFSNADIKISDATLSVSAIVDLGGVTPGSAEITTTGDQGPNGTFTKTEIITPGWTTLSGGYGYDARGNKTDFRIRESTSYDRTDRRTYLEETRTSSGSLYTHNGFLDPNGHALSTEDSYTTSDEVFPYQSLDFGDSTIRFDAGGEKFSRNTQEIRESWVVSTTPVSYREYIRRTGSSSLVRQDSIPTILFIDPLTDLYITSYHTHEGVVTTTTDYTWVSPPGGQDGETDNSTTTTNHSYGHRLVAVCRGQEFLRVDTELTGPEQWAWVQYVASSAIDPLTGAVCVNVLELDTRAGTDAPPLRSWIILADDKWAKMLHEVMEVPESTNIRIKKDYALLSVV